MKKGRSLYQIVEKIGQYSREMGGVFSAADLVSLIGLESPLAAARTISRLISEGVTERVQRGIYVTKEFDLWQLSARLIPGSYVSMDSALAREGLIGAVPEFGLSAVHVGRARSIETSRGKIRFYSISKDLFFGFETLPSGIHVACAEKAFIDVLYYYMKGIRFVMDPLKEIAIERLNRDRVFEYLDRYKNPKFVTFVKGLFREKP
jgi:predicted transcriptional regulator of viral defense system